MIVVPAVPFQAQIYITLLTLALHFTWLPVGQFVFPKNARVVYPVFLTIHNAFSYYGQKFDLGAEIPIQI